MPTLTEQQRRFVDHYVQTANAAEAARQAGYSEHTARQQAYYLLRKPHIQAAVNEGVKSQMARYAPAAIKRLVELTQSENERVALSAAADLADRAGLKPKQETELTLKDDRSDDELLASIRAKMSELGINGGTTH